MDILKNIEESIIQEEKIKESFLNKHENVLLIFISVIFALASSFFVQSYFIKNQELLLKKEFINSIYTPALIIIILIILLIILALKSYEKKVERAHKNIFRLLKQYVKIWDEEVNGKNKSRY